MVIIKINEPGGNKMDLVLYLVPTLVLLVLVTFLIPKKKVSEQQRFTRNLEIAANAILLTEGGNQPRSVKKKQKQSVQQSSNASFQTVANDFITSIKYISKGVKGTSSPKEKSTDPTQLLNQRVSTLRRIFFNQGMPVEEAESTIDFYLVSINAQNYTKSKRRENWVYAPILQKRP
jgi:hypothetical protein